MTESLPRIRPLEPPYPPETAQWLNKWMPPGGAHEPLLLFRTLATHPEFTGRMRPLGAGILGRSSRIDPRERELAIARTCARCGCEYEWGVHVASLGAGAGLTQATIRATVEADAADGVWNDRDRLLVRLVDALHDRQRIPDGLWGELSAAWSAEQLIELIVTVGWYHLISFLANGTDLAPEPWAARWPGR
jgi:alkylhydroperoxidase family enzyme